MVQLVVRVPWLCRRSDRNGTTAAAAANFCGLDAVSVANWLAGFASDPRAGLLRGRHANRSCTAVRGQGQSGFEAGKCGNILAAPQSDC